MIDPMSMSLKELLNRSERYRRFWQGVRGTQIGVGVGPKGQVMSPRNQPNAVPFL